MSRAAAGRAVLEQTAARAWAGGAGQKVDLILLDSSAVSDLDSKIPTNGQSLAAKMCSNQLIESVECYMDEIFDTFEEFLKKSLVVVSISIGTVVFLLIYVTNIASGRGTNLPACCQQSATATGGTTTSPTGAKNMAGSGGAMASTTEESPCPPRPCPPPENCPDAPEGDIIECDGKCPNKNAEKKGGFFNVNDIKVMRSVDAPDKFKETSFEVDENDGNSNNEANAHTVNSESRVIRKGNDESSKQITPKNCECCAVCPAADF